MRQEKRNEGEMGDAAAAYYEKLVHNAQKGDPYFIKLKNDPIIYRAIPLVDHRVGSSADQQFMMKVLLPESHKGIYLHTVNEIEMMDTDPWHYTM